MNRAGRLLVAATLLLPLVGGRGFADSVTPRWNALARGLEVLVNVGPWPTLSALIGYPDPPDNSLLFDLNSLFGRKKFPVPLRRKFSKIIT